MSATCTVVIGPKMERCGKQAVTTFTARNGDTLAECADHVVNIPGPLAVGSAVDVYFAGRTIVGIVTAVRQTTCSVEVPLVKGGSKVVNRPIVEVATR